MKPCPECHEDGPCLSSCQTGAEIYELKMADLGMPGYGSYDEGGYNDIAEQIDEDTALGYTFNQSKGVKVP